jgi:hypothetical protein
MIRAYPWWLASQKCYASIAPTSSASGEDRSGDMDDPGRADLHVNRTIVLDK